MNGRQSKIIRTFWNQSKYGTRTALTLLINQNEKKLPIGTSKAEEALLSAINQVAVAVIAACIRTSQPIVPARIKLAQLQRP